MPQSISEYITQYGYLAVFILVFMQETGIPSFPNEIVLAYFGYLSNKTSLSFPLVFLLVIIADVSGSCLLYFLFYYFNSFIIKLKPTWLKLPEQTIGYIKNQLLNEEEKKIFIGRLIPFVRGYIPVVAGLIRVDIYKYISTVFVSALLWSGGWVIAGWLAANYCNDFMAQLTSKGSVIISILSLLIILFILKYFIKKVIRNNIQKSLYEN
jgi:membrane protein DedA with SNARE-associated domain